MFAFPHDIAGRRAALTRVVLQFMEEHGFVEARAALCEEAVARGVLEGDAAEVHCLPRGGMLEEAVDLLVEMERHTTPAIDAAVPGGGDVVEANVAERELLRHVSPEDAYVARERSVLAGLHATNIIAAKFHRDPARTLLATGSTDSSVKLVDWKSGMAVHSVEGVFGSPVLSLDFNPNPALHDQLAVALMNGSHYIIDTAAGQADEDGSVGSSSVLQTCSDHTRYAVRIKWAPSGRAFATASHDHSVKLYVTGEGGDGDEPADSGAPVWRCVKTMNFVAEVEAIEWLPNATNDLVIAVRDDNYLHVMDGETLEPKGRHNMNALGDDHVSFTAMDLKASSDGRYLLASTDRHRIIMFEANSDRQLRNFYGATNDAFCNPRCLWSQAGSHVYGTSQGDNSIFTWDIGSQKVVATMAGHQAVVRDLDQHPSLDILCSASYDKTVRLWS